MDRQLRLVAKLLNIQISIKVFKYLNPNFKMIQTSLHMY